MADRRRPVPTRESECESEHGEGNPNEDLSEYESANEESKDGEAAEEEEEDDSEETDSEEGETTEEDEDEEGEYSESVIVEGEYEDGWVEEERQSGDGQEQPEASQDDLDDDEDKKNPAYVPRKGAFYEHDMRIEEIGGELKEERPKKKLWKDDGKWLHDRYCETQQAPKSREELIALYGYDIRAHDKPPDRAPRMNRNRDGNPRGRKQLGDFMTERSPSQKTGTPPRYSNNSNYSNRDTHENEDDRPQYDNNRQRSSYQNRQNSYNEERRGQTYTNLKDGGPRDSHGNRYSQQKSYESREVRQDSRGQNMVPVHQDVRYRDNTRQREDNDRRPYDNDYRGNRERKGPSDRDHRGPFERPSGRGRGRGRRGPPEDDHRGPPGQDHRGPPERDHRGPPERDHRGPPERDHRGPPERDHRGPPGSDHRGPPERDHRGPQERDHWGPPRNQGGRGPRLQRGGHSNSGDNRNNRDSVGDVRNNKPNFRERGNDSQPRQFTNSAYQGHRVIETPAEVKPEEPDPAETIQINVVNKNALVDRKSYSRERRVGRTRIQQSSGFSIDQTLVKEDRALIPPPRQAPPSQVTPREQKPTPSPTLPTSPSPMPQDHKAYPPPPIVKQEVAQSRPKRYSSQRQRSLPEPQYPEQAASPVENQAYFSQGFRPPAPIFRPEQPGPSAPRPRQEAPFPPTAMLPPPQLHYPVPVSTAGLSSPPRLFAGGPPVSLPTGQPLIAPQYMPTGMMYGAPPYRMPGPVPVQNFPSPPPVAVPVPQPVQLSAQPSPAEVYRGGTTYYAPQLQQTNPHRSPVRRAKSAIPIIRPEESADGTQYYIEEQDPGDYGVGEEEYVSYTDDSPHPDVKEESYPRGAGESVYTETPQAGQEWPQPHGDHTESDIKEERSNYPRESENPSVNSDIQSSTSTHPITTEQPVQETSASSAGDTTDSRVKLEPPSKQEIAPVESSNPAIAAGGDNLPAGHQLREVQSDTSEIVDSPDSCHSVKTATVKAEPDRDFVPAESENAGSQNVVETQPSVQTESETS